MDIKQLFPIKRHFAYFNNATNGAMSSSCLEAITSTVNTMATQGIDLELYRELKEVATTTRGKLATLLHAASTDNFLFTESTTQGINLLACSLSIKKGETIFTRAGINEHPSNYVPWLYNAKRNRANIIDIPVDRNGLPSLEEFDTVLGKAKNPRLVVLGHVIYNLGTILPVEELTRIAHDHGALVFLDVAQSAGSLPLRLDAIGCDFAAGTAAKWLCGPFGLGFVYFRKEALPNLDYRSYQEGLPPINTVDAYDSVEMPLFYFRNYAYVAGLEKSLDILIHFGIQRVRAINKDLVRAVIENLGSMQKSYQILGDFDEKIRASLIAIEPKAKRDSNLVVKTTVKKLAQKGVVVALREFEGRKIIRISPHFFNDDGEVSSLISNLRNSNE